MFQIPEWESNASSVKKQQKPSKNVKLGYVDKSKKRKVKKTKLKKEVIPLLQAKPKLAVKPTLKTTNNVKSNAVKKIKTSSVDNTHQTSKPNAQSRKKPVTHQTLFLKSNKHRKRKPLNDSNSVANPAYDFNLSKSTKHLPLRERMLQKLKSARFRYLNEQMYTGVGKTAKKYFESDPNAYAAYHDGYRQQVAKWPLNPIDVIIPKIKKLPQNFIVADFGCGEAKLANSTSHCVHCFDLVAINDRVTACDMAHVPLKDNSVDVVVFCLSLMGTNLKDYIAEAKRVLKNKGSLLIAEVESRFEDVDVFIKNMRLYGFINTAKDYSHNLFFFLDFVKHNTKVQSNLPNITLKPCLYKKR